MSAVRLTPEEFRRAADGPLHAVFKSFDLAGGPFRDTVEERFILGDLDSFRVDEPLYEAICSAAQAVGDDRVFYSVIRAYRGGIEYHTWALPLFDYQAYEAPYFDRLTKEDYDVGTSLDGVMYSPRGEWGILFPELFTLAGGSPRFAEALKRQYPLWRADLDSFLKRFGGAFRERRVDVSWVQPLLNHVYGVDAPVFAP